MKSNLLMMVLFSAASFGQQTSNAPYLDPDLSPEQRAADLVSRMTLEEKVLQMQSSPAPEIPRLGVPAYYWGGEALHGVVEGRATVFPQAIGLAATWDTALMHRVADAISTEARAKYNHLLCSPCSPQRGSASALSPATVSPVYGLTFFSPNINIFRDPRWGRGQETYGEDPYLTSRMGVAFVTGMQGNDPRYLKVVSTPKHYAVHSGPELERHVFDARVSEYDKVNTYLLAFRAAVIEGKAQSIMCVYNAVDGVPGCANADLLENRLRIEWGFRGYVVSDCGAVDDIHRNHKYTQTLAGAAAAAVRAGTDLTCGTEYETLVEEVKSGNLSEAAINRAVERLYTARFGLGMFDPPERVPFSTIPISANDSAEHRQLARNAEREAIVLLKNQGGFLPLSESVRKIAVIGPSADDPVALLGNYHGISSKQVTPLEGIERQFSQAEVRYALGATYTATTPALVPRTALMAPDGGHGVQAEYFDNPDLEGDPKLSRREPRVYFDWQMEEPAVVAAIGRAEHSVRWTGTLKPVGDGRLSFYCAQWIRQTRYARTSISRRNGTGFRYRFFPASTGPVVGRTRLRVAGGIPATRARWQHATLLDSSSRRAARRG
ncbi:MAG: glycoside hydrolase family 3 C-terminal domain-containing protein [Acidobacteria bacterium]|nr:glycoside hydrolase family 3 C-terminal domain-containing protein [Acidobacteriota bacterium]